MEEDTNSSKSGIPTLISKEIIDNEFLGEFKNDFKILKLFDQNNISKIYEAENIKEKRNVHLKVFDKNQLQLCDYDFFLAQIKREEEITKICKSDNIVNIYQKLETKNSIIFELELCELNMDKYIELIDSLENNNKLFTQIIIELSEALKILNINGIMHRDIKPSNIFLKKKNKGYIVKLGGFGCSIYIKDNISEPIGSILYMAPEIIKSLQYDEKCDLWSLGISLYEIYFGELPYGKNVTLYSIKNSIYNNEEIHLKKSYNPIFNELFKKLLTVNRKNRIDYFNFFVFISKINKKKLNEYIDNEDYNDDYDDNINNENFDLLKSEDKKNEEDFFETLDLESDRGITKLNKKVNFNIFLKEENYDDDYNKKYNSEIFQLDFKKQNIFSMKTVEIKKEKNETLSKITSYFHGSNRYKNLKNLNLSKILKSKKIK